MERFLVVVRRAHAVFSAEAFAEPGEIVEPYRVSYFGDIDFLPGKPRWQRLLPHTSISCHST